MIDRLRAWLQSDVLADSEADSDRNGYLSWVGEWHSAVWGFAAAFLAAVTGELPILVAAVGWLFTTPSKGDAPQWLPYPSQFRTESLYLIAHAVAGLAVGVVARPYLFG